MSNPPPSDDFRALGHKPDCLSTLTLSELAAAMRPPTPEEAAHLSTCPDCPAQLAAEQREVEAARRAPVPTGLRRPRRRFSPRAAYTAAAAVATLSLVWVVNRPGPPQPDAHFKGGVAVLVTVMQDGVQQQTDTPIEQLGHLPVGAQLSMRLGRPGIRHVRIVSREQGAPVELFKGPTSNEGTLPYALRLTEGPTRLRLTVCDDEALTLHCETHDIEL